ncbi:hypothetical protein [Arthrobacter sp. MMS18-M83]|nr:hypothetical protein [Arthrobacter sp. MMS18-M83]WAH97457.1 hypothetical protein OW521_00670 [Arthrobacter sp. MMS18-M83]
MREASGGRIQAIVGNAADPDALQHAIRAAADEKGRLQNLTCG